MFEVFDRKELYKKLIDRYQEKQIIVAIEELSELAKELCKNLRGRNNKNHIVEEIADVEIMLEQLILYFDISEIDVKVMKQVKLQRTKRLIEE